MAVSLSPTARIGHGLSGFITALTGFFALFSAAVKASQAVRSGRQPTPAVLEKLGLSAQMFPHRPV